MKFAFFRGFSTIAREKNINLHSTWQLETLAGSFPEIDKLMSDKKEASSDSYFLTPVYKLPDTWESVRFFCVPILDAYGARLVYAAMRSAVYISPFPSKHWAADRRIFLVLC